VKFGVLGFIRYDYIRQGGTTRNTFTLGRAYLTLKGRITSWLGARITTDTTRAASGNWDIRLKYLYAEFRTPDAGNVITGIRIEAGQGHTPWLDFEEHINPYRCQGTMAVERAGIFNSADLGVSVAGRIGPTLPGAKGSGHYAGKWGSLHLGVFNGGGYHAKEANNNKVVQARLTVRPMPGIAPGLQLSWFGAYGKGNTLAANGVWPLYYINLVMLSYQHPWFTLAAQYFRTRGNASGSYAGLTTQGYSGFGMARLPWWGKRLALFARYDHFDADVDHSLASQAWYDLFTGGLSVRIYKHNMVVLAYQGTRFGKDSGGTGKPPKINTNKPMEHRFQVICQVKF
jgi:hypothetical protein